MYKLYIFPLCFIMIACNAKQETKTVDNNYSLNNLLSEFKNMNIGRDYTKLEKEGLVKQVDDTEIIDNCLYAETKDENIDYLVFDNKISTASYQKSEFMGITAADLKSKVKDLSLVKSAYDDNTYYLQHQFDNNNGVKFYIVENKVAEVTYGTLDKLKYQEGCS
ncbi:hypothetical protein IAE19_12525 [Acinetobacter sp. S40]|uniref:hypothetical protein n=1 Tax=Acinetobacter sp. S40 TaxID=2767434 RepID=UPI00190DB165|nr:hypothetical protein [Acinetobacter sp. S40]MBJ9986257.1 hypothetical protein [Acinetobacter sp. S40]